MELPECLSYSSVVSEQRKKEKKVFMEKNFELLFRKIDYWLTINLILITIKFVLVLGKRLMSRSILSYAV